MKKAKINKSEVMKDANRMYRTSLSADENFEVSFAELLSLSWSIARQSLKNYLQAGQVNNFITLK